MIEWKYLVESLSNDGSFINVTLCLLFIKVCRNARVNTCLIYIRFVRKATWTMVSLRINIYLNREMVSLPPRVSIGCGSESGPDHALSGIPFFQWRFGISATVQWSHTDVRLTFHSFKAYAKNTRATHGFFQLQPLGVFVWYMCLKNPDMGSIKRWYIIQKYKLTTIWF